VSTEQDATRALVVAAMMQALDQKKRDELIGKALEALVAPSSTNYGYGSNRPGPSELENAFRDAMRNLAQKIVAEMVNTDDVRAKIRDVAAAAFEKMVSNKDALAEKMAAAIVEAMTRTS
jgi:hypothetical protein